MIARKIKMFLAMSVVGILGGATPAMAHNPYYDTRVELAVGAPSWSIGFGFSRPAPRYERYDRYDYSLMRRGQDLEARGQSLVAEGRNLEWRGQRFGRWHLARKGERLQARGYELIRQGRALQAQARYTYAW